MKKGRVPAGSVPSRDWQWNHRGASHDGVHTYEGCLTWYTEAGHGGGGATSQTFDDFLSRGAPVQATPAVLAELHALLLPLVPDATPAERLAWAAEAGDRVQIEAALASGAEIDGKSGKGGSALDRAVRDGHVSAIELLVSRGAQATLATWQATKDPAAVEALARAGAADDVSAHARVLGAAASFNPAAGPRIQEALDALRDAAVAGRDLSTHETALVAATHAVSHTNDLRRLAQALCWDCVRAGDGRRLARLVRATQHPYHLMEELEHAAREGRAVGPVLRGLIEGLQGDREEGLLRDRLARAIVAHLTKQAPDELGAIAGLLAGAPGILGDVVKDLHGAGRDVAPALGVVAQAAAGKGDGARRAASTLARVSGRADLSAYEPVLRARLCGRDATDRRQAALSMGRELLRREPPDWSPFDGELGGSKSVPVRAGALIALSWALRTGRDAAAASSRIVRSLLDPDDNTREHAASVLSEAQRDGLALAPDAAALVAMVQKLDDARLGPGVDRFLHDFAGRDDQGSRAVAAALGERSGERARELRRACEGYLARTLRRPCTTCSNLPAENAWGTEGSLPKEIHRLQPGDGFDKVGKRERRCPECGNVYETTYEAEYDVNSVDETFTLKRLAPPELYARLTGDLRHPHPAIQAEARRLLGSS